MFYFYFHAPVNVISPINALQTPYNAYHSPPPLSTPLSTSNILHNIRQAQLEKE